MRVLITGIEGFAGRHLAHRLVADGHEVWGTTRRTRPGADWPADLPVSTHRCDVASREDVLDVVRLVRPDEVYHLAALSHVPLSWRDPEGAIRTNLVGTLHVLEAVRDLSPRSRVLLVSTSEVYGRADGGRPRTEEDLTAPETPYAVSKLAAEHLGYSFMKEYGLAVLAVRPYNHTGPGQRPPFVLPTWARQVARIEAGLEPPELAVGNLKVRRDFSDVRDVVEAYVLVLRKGAPGECFNVGRGEPTSLSDVLERLLSRARVPVTVREDPALVRPNEPQSLACDPGRLMERTGWSPRIPLERTLDDLLSYWREVTAQGDAPTPERGR